jgi:phenylacetate-CoA ligase
MPRFDPDTTAVSNRTYQAWPAVRNGLASEIVALHGELLESERLPPEVLEAAQMAQFREMLAFAAPRSGTCARQLAASGRSVQDFQSHADLRNLPLLGREDLQRAGDDLFCENVPGDQGRIFETSSSGSTGQPVVVRKTGINQLFWSAYLLRQHYWHDTPFDVRYTVIRQSAKEYSETADWGPPYVHLFRTGPVQSIPITTPLTEQVRLLREFQPEMLLIYPTNLRPLLDLWREGDPAFANVRHLRSIGEACPRDLKEAIAEIDPSISYVDTYSSEELGTIAVDCPEGPGLHVMAESLILEVLDDAGQPCAPGQTGRVVVTDIQNLATPLIRYDTGDYAVAGRRCVCGRGLPVLESVEGRHRNLLTKPNGDRNFPILGHNEYREIAPTVRQFQLVQETVDTVRARFATDAPLSDEERAGLTAFIQETLGYPFQVVIEEQRESIPRQPGGKYEDFISLVD